MPSERALGPSVSVGAGGSSAVIARRTASAEPAQAVTPLYYAAGEEPLPPLVLVGREHWTERVPVWPALTAIAAGRPMAEAIHLVDRVEDVLALLPSPATAA